MNKRLLEGMRFGHGVLANLEDSIVKSRDCNSLWVGHMEFEVGGSRGGTVVDLTRWTCTCRAWQLNGIPCCHVVSAISLMRRDPEDYMYECLSGETYLRCYGQMLRAMNGPEKWPQSDKPMLLPPPPRVVKGRPKWNRMKDALEDGGGKSTTTNENQLVVHEDPFKNSKKSKKGIKMTCRQCKQEGHNIKKCPDRPVNENPKAHTDEDAPIPPLQREKQTIRRRKSAGSGNMVSTNGLDASFTRRARSFITSDSLHQQSKNRKKRS